MLKKDKHFYLPTADLTCASMLHLKIETTEEGKEVFLIIKYDEDGGITHTTSYPSYEKALARLEKMSGYPLTERQKRGIKRLNPEEWDQTSEREKVDPLPFTKDL